MNLTHHSLDGGPIEGEDLWEFDHGGEMPFEAAGSAIAEARSLLVIVDHMANVSAVLTHKSRPQSHPDVYR